MGSCGGHRKATAALRQVFRQILIIRAGLRQSGRCGNRRRPWAARRRAAVVRIRHFRDETRGAGRRL